MLVSYNWLKEYVEFDFSPQTLADKLTMAGLEIEELTDLTPEGIEDFVLSIKVTPNRGDCLSLIGIAREIGAIVGSPLKLPPLQFDEIDQNAQELAAIEIIEPTLCPRYSARIIRNIKVRPSPLWLQNRLLISGMRPINNIVDITNYVMLELGQPLHAFDYHTIKDAKIIVRRAAPNEKITTLDEMLRTLSEDDLLITDPSGPIAIAGVMGGLYTQVSDYTRDVLLESANFNPVSIRKTAKRLGISSESAYRFERGVDVSGTIRTLDRAAKLMVELADGKVAKGVIDEYPNPFKPIKLELRPQLINKVLGTRLSKDKIASILNTLQFPTKSTKNKIKVTIPTFRQDINEEIDLVEEVARIYGYDKIPSTLPSGETALGKDDSTQELEAQARQILTACGLCEVVTFSLTHPKVFDLIRVPPDSRLRNYVKIRNPLSEDYTILRTTLIPSLLEILARNTSRQIDDIYIFELGRIYLQTQPNQPAQEQRTLAAAIMGKRWLSSWNLEPQMAEADFFLLKGFLESFLTQFGITDYQFVKYQTPTFHPGRCAQLIIAHKPTGTIGEIHPDILETYDLTKPVYLFELNFDLLTQQIKPTAKFIPPPKYPAISRDISLIAPDELTSQEIIDTMRTAGGELIETIQLFDLYQGDQIPPKHKSLAYSLQFRAPNRTLTDEEVDNVLVEIKTALKNKLGVTIRE